MENIDFFRKIACRHKLRAIFYTEARGRKRKREFVPKDWISDQESETETVENVLPQHHVHPDPDERLQQLRRELQEQLLLEESLNMDDMVEQERERTVQSHLDAMQRHHLIMQ